MGVKGYCYMLKCSFRETHCIIEDHYDILMIDGNCILHEVISDLKHEIDPSVKVVIDTITKKFKEILQRTKYDKIFIVLDGVPPIPKQFCQRVRRKNEMTIAAFLLPNTKLMNFIECLLVSNFQGSIVEIIGSRIDGEGEQKIFDVLKTYGSGPRKKVHILSVDSDIIILSQIFIKIFDRFDIFVETTMFALIFDIRKINVQMKNYNIYENRHLLLFCMLCGNDFFPRLTEILELKNIDVLRLVGTTEFKIFSILISGNVCTKKCSKQQIENYLNTWRWYYKYFTTNDFVSCKPYEYENSPCCLCLTDKPFEDLNSYTEDQPEKSNHLNYVLSEVALAHSLC